MTIDESLAFVRDFQAMAGGLLEAVDVVICPPFTALYPVAQLLGDSRLQLGAQNMATSTELGRTAEISADVVANAGCHWVMLGHWEVRRHLGDSDVLVNVKVHIALEAGLMPILLIGPGRVETGSLEEVIHAQLSRVLAGCGASQVAGMAFIYEPETAIGAAAPITPGQVAEGCGLMRDLLRGEWGNRVSEQVRIIYGGSVSPEHAVDLLTSPEVDGLGASRKGRDPVAFLEIVRQIALVKGR
ncbi:MAG: triosephosphate isomerase [Anaerolineales bacterium]|nr:triosephosphate isomerase [Anaerolineales bacterium]